jgi:hypothetical protein
MLLSTINDAVSAAMMGSPGARSGSGICFIGLLRKKIAVVYEIAEQMSFHWYFESAMGRAE